MIHTHPCFLNKLYTVETGQGDLYLAKSRNTNNLQLVKPEDALVAKTRNDKNILLIPKRTDRKIKTKEPAIKKKSSYVPEPTNKVECLGKNCYLKTAYLACPQRVYGHHSWICAPEVSRYDIRILSPDPAPHVRVCPVKTRQGDTFVARTRGTRHPAGATWAGPPGTCSKMTCQCSEPTACYVQENKSVDIHYFQS